MESQSEFERQLARYVGRIDQIDRIVAEPVRTLIDLGFEPWKRSGVRREQGDPADRRADGGERAPESLYFPPWIAEDGQATYFGSGPGGRRLWLTTAQCCATLQRIWSDRRRHRWLERGRLRGHSSPSEALGELRRAFAPTFRPGERGLAAALPVLDSPTYGVFNVFSAARVFRVLVNEGEAAAHGGLGFLSFFRMVWSLRRRFPDELSSGAALSNLPPSAYVTAKCLLPIRDLTKTCWRRRTLLRKIAGLVKELEASDGGGEGGTADDSHRRWCFARDLELLAALLHELAPIAINREGFRGAAERVLGVAEQDDPDLRGRWRSVRSVLWEALESLSEVTGVAEEPPPASGGEGTVLGESRKVLSDIGRALGPVEGVLAGLEEARGDGREAGSDRLPSASLKKLVKCWRDIEAEMGLPGGMIEQWSKEVVEWGSRGDYVQDLVSAARESLDLCRKAHDRLGEAAKMAREAANGTDPEQVAPRSDSDPDPLVATLEELARANDDVARSIDDAVALSARWCRGAVEREIARISAGNLTDFDPSELVSGLAVAVRWGVMSQDQVADAVRKAVEGARTDGSWIAGQPFYSRDYSLNVAVPTSEIVGLLAGALSEHPRVRDADEALMRYVDWLERTRVRLRIGGARRTGWPSDRSRTRRRIDLGVTALAVGALLDIRDLLEFRLWELCEERFTVLEPRSGLDRVDPVDLDAPHVDRLHRRLFEMARLSGGEGFGKADYSLVLHGPPGSSKTTIAEAIAYHSWTASQRWGPRSRLVRITPADFTRGGEDRIDLEARLIFELLGRLRGVTVLFDEIDDLLRKRPASREQMRFLDLVVPAMLNRLADLREACPRQEVCFLVATNFIEKIDPALIRKGRIDDPVYVGYPDWTSREMMYQRLLAGLGKSDAQEPSGRGEALKPLTATFVERTAGWPWKTIQTALKRIGRLAEPVKDRVGEVLDELGRSFTEPDYTDRLLACPTCSPLLDELVSHLLTLRGGEGEFPGERITTRLEELRRAGEGEPRRPEASRLVGEVEERLRSAIVRRGGEPEG